MGLIVGSLIVGPLERKSQVYAIRNPKGKPQTKNLGKVKKLEDIRGFFMSRLGEVSLLFENRKLAISSRFVLSAIAARLIVWAVISKPESWRGRPQIERYVGCCDGLNNSIDERFHFTLSA